MEDIKVLKAIELIDKVQGNEYNTAIRRFSYTKDQVKELMIEFAKLHVKEALKEASENAMLKVVNTEEFRDIEEKEDLVDTYESGSDVVHISVNSILNAYPDDNIV